MASTRGAMITVTVSVALGAAGVPTPLSAVIVNVKRPAVFAGIVPERTPLPSIESHDGAPLSEKLAAGTPSTATGKRTLPTDSGTLAEAADVICGAASA